MKINLFLCFLHLVWYLDNIVHMTVTVFIIDIVIINVMHMTVTVII